MRIEIICIYYTPFPVAMIKYFLFYHILHSKLSGDKLPKKKKEN